MSSFAALQYALAGIQTGYRDLAQSAHEIATSHSGEPEDLVEPLVDALVQQRALEASASIMRRADEMLGTLIDTFA